MVIYPWEQQVSDWFASFPRDGALFEVMHLISYPNPAMRVVIVVMFLAFCWRKRLQGIVTTMLALIAVGFGDLASRRLVKQFIVRPRPHFVNQICQGSHCWGFVSSHMTNICAFVTVFALYNPKHLRWGLPIIVLVAVSRLYLLDHYSLDVLGGAALGTAVGFVIFGAARVFASLLQKKRHGQNLTAVLLFIISCTFSGHALAGDQLAQGLFSSFTPNNLAHDFISPVSVNEARPSFITGASVTLAADIFRHDIDKPVDDFFERTKPLGESGLASRLGTLIPNLVYFVGMSSAYEVTREADYARYAVLMFRSTLHSALMTTILKHTIREGRPYNHFERNSFPSGHTTTTFAFASAVAMAHSWRWGLPAYALATFVGLGRINDHQHHLYDVLAGATIGASYGVGVFERMRIERGEETSFLSCLNLLPTADLSGTEIRYAVEY